MTVPRPHAPAVAVERLRWADAAEQARFPEFLSTCRPVICEGLASTAAESGSQGQDVHPVWSPDALAQTAPVGLKVNVAMNIEERSGQTCKRLVGFRDYVEKLAALPLEATSADLGYLKQLPCGHVVHNELSTLLDRVLVLFPRALAPTAFLWAGPAGCCTGLHSDDEHNFLVQLHGHKRVTLVPARHRAALYVNSKYDSGTECCDVDCEHPDLQRHPMFQRVIEDHALMTASLRPGDVLFIPRWCFHQVTSETVSVSVNVFVSDVTAWCREGLPRAFFSILHSMGLYKRRNCVCCGH